MNNSGGWMNGMMGGGMVGGIWFWTVIGILVGIFLFFTIKMFKK